MQGSWLLVVSAGGDGDVQREDFSSTSQHSVSGALHMIMSPGDTQVRPLVASWLEGWVGREGWCMLYMLRGSLKLMPSLTERGANDLTIKHNRELVGMQRLVNGG